MAYRLQGWVAAHLPEEVAQDGDSTVLTQGLVPVAALGRLNAGRTALFAGAAGEDAKGIAGHLLEGVVAALGDADAARVAVVDEDGRQVRLTVHGDGEPPDVPPVAHREERQQPDKGVLRRVQGAQELTKLGWVLPGSARGCKEGRVNQRPRVSNSVGGRSRGKTPTSCMSETRIFLYSVTTSVVRTRPQ